MLDSCSIQCYKSVTKLICITLKYRQISLWIIDTLGILAFCQTHHRCPTELFQMQMFVNNIPHTLTFTLQSSNRIWWICFVRFFWELMHLLLRTWPKRGHHWWWHPTFKFTKQLTSGCFRRIRYNSVFQISFMVLDCICYFQNAMFNQNMKLSIVHCFRKTKSSILAFLEFV